MSLLMRAPVRPRVAIALLAAVVLLVQIAATRLLSATVSYHAAFVVLALVMLALAGSAAAVYRDRFLTRNGEPAQGKAGRMAMAAGPTIALTGLGYVVVGAVPWPPSLYDVMHFGAAGVGLYASFYCCGYLIAWLLASWADDVGRVYFADLMGAASGCLLAVPALAMAGPVQILVACGFIVSIAGLILGEVDRGFARSGRWLAGGLAVVTVLVFAGPSWVRLRSAKLQSQSTVLSERWNHLARVTVGTEVPGTSQAIGGGGGRDFLTALAFGAKTVDVVELNSLVLDAVQDTFGEFSGRPYTRAGVQYRLGDARSELSRSSAQYDLIQMSMIDTWAASMAGALMLTENGL